MHRPSSAPPSRPASRIRPGRPPAWLPALLALLWPAIASADDGGFVVELQGDWRVEQPAPGPLRRWDEVPAGATLRIVGAGRGDRLQIVDRQGLPLLLRNCAVATECEGPVTVGPPAPGNAAAGGMQAMLAGLIGRLRATPDRPSSHISRGAADGPALLESVLATGDTLDLSPVFAQAPAGRYRLRVQPVRDDGTRGEPLGPLEVDWAPGAALPVGAGSPPLPAGLYEVVLLRQTGSGRARASGTAAWVVLAPPGRHRELAHRFDQARALTAGWGDRIESDAARVLLRTWLEEVARDPAR